MAAHRLMKQNRTTRKAYVETYGCQMNVSDSELMQGILAAEGYEIASSPEEADVVLVNTCAIREHAEQRVIGRVGQLNRIKRDRPDLVIGVTGCMAQRLGESILERAPYVDLVMGPDGYRGLPAVLARLRPHRPAGARNGYGPTPATGGTSSRIPLPVLTGGGASTLEAPAAPSPAAATRLAVLEFHAHENYEGLESRRAAGVSAWVPIQRGCDHRCTYCIVPFVRGPEKNRDPARVLGEIRQLAAAGVREVTLLGQTVNSYRHHDWDFPRLLREVARVEGIRRVRFTSPHPNDVTPSLVEVMAAESAVCRQLHLPLQAGHDRTLRRMLRRHTVADYLAKVTLLRSAMPDIALSTDVIVAFPGETRDEFEATLDVMREVRFDDAFLYRYSAREGTPATRLPADQSIPAAEAQARLEATIALHRSIQAEINRAEVGRTIEVLVERAARSPGDVLGRAASNKVVAFPGTAGLHGTFCHVRLLETSGATFAGVRVEQGHESRVA
jgi:tRNA-2-methylthio-N6-dimethylallyladenosine synthase